MTARRSSGLKSRMTECTHLKQLLLTDDLTLIRYYWTRVFETCQGTVCTEPLQLQCLKCAHLLVRGTTISCPECRAHVELCFHTAAIHLYCTGCQDIVYDPEFDAARCHAMISAGNNTRMYFEPVSGKTAVNGYIVNPRRELDSAECAT